MMFNDDDLFLVGCVKLSVIKNFMCEIVGNDEIVKVFLKYIFYRIILGFCVLFSICFCEGERIWIINLNVN